MDKSQASLTDIVKGHIERVLTRKGDLYYFGSLSEYSADSRPDDKAIRLQRQEGKQGRVHSGYLVHKPNSNWFSISYISDLETFYFKLSNSAVQIKASEPQITRDVPVLRQAIVKEDWVTPQPGYFVLKGDYSKHIRLSAESLEMFERDGSSDLWLPSFFLPPN